MSSKKVGSFKCVSPGCPLPAEPGSEYCIVCQGKAPRTKAGFVVWNGKAYCPLCDSKEGGRPTSKGIVKVEVKGTKVFCPVHGIQL